MQTVLGYMKHNRDGTETHYAADAFEILSCTVNSPTVHFGAHPNGAKGQWEAVDNIPKNAEFIGNYPKPGK